MVCDVIFLNKKHPHTTITWQDILTTANVLCAGARQTSCGIKASHVAIIVNNYLSTLGF